MPASAAPVTTAQVLKVHDALARYVYGNFKRGLTFEEARDVAAEALAEADRAVAAGTEIRDLKQWLRTAAWRNALDAIRRRVGEGATPRERPVELLVEDLGERFTYRPDEELLDGAARRADADALRAAWGRLARDEQRALHLRYFDELPVPAVLELLGCSRDHYENLTKRALRKLREALVTGAQDDACRRCRTLVVQGGDTALAGPLVDERDAHLDGCLSCRAFARRSRGLIAALPLPAVGLLDRLLARVQAHGAGASDAAQAGEAIAGATALAGGAATAGGGVAGTGLLGALGASSAAKTAAVLCSAGAVTAGVCVPAVTRDRPAPTKSAAERPATTRSVAAAERARPSRQVPVSPTPAAAITTPPVAEQRPATPNDRARPAERDRRAEASPFLPESAADPAPQAAGAGGSQPRAGTYDAVPATSTTTAQRGPESFAAAADPRPEPKTPSPPSSSFSQEFSP